MVMNPDKLRRYTVGVLVSNEPGVLSRVSGLFSRRGFNIESLAVRRRIARSPASRSWCWATTRTSSSWCSSSTS